jgi:acetyl esterase/lipase
MSFELATGAEARWTGRRGPRAVLCVNGGTAAEVAGTWSASVEWLVRELAPRLPLRFLEVRYRVKSWRRFDDCVADAAAALAAARDDGAEEVAVLAFSMGGAVAVQLCVSETRGVVPVVVGVNPWLPPQLDLRPLVGRRLAIVHGALDAPLPGVPGVQPAMSRDAWERARALGVDAERVVVPGAFHAVALRRRQHGGLVSLPGSRRYRHLVGAELERFCA